jgi:hypothetical protein
MTDYLYLRRYYGLELAEYKAIDTYSYKKARLTLYGSADASVIEAVVEWLEQQDDWLEIEMDTPELYREMVRDSLMLERESKEWLSSRRNQATGTSTSIPKDNSPPTAST